MAENIVIPLLKPEVKLSRLFHDSMILYHRVVAPVISYNSSISSFKLTILLLFNGRRLWPRY